MACFQYRPTAAYRVVKLRFALDARLFQLRIESFVELFMSVEPRDVINAHRDQDQVDNLVKNARDYAILFRRL